MKPVWLKEALFSGQTANGFKTGITLTLGWFWTRGSGCRWAYRGGSMETIDFDRILAITGPDDNEITLPDYLSYEPGEVYYYVVRCVNGCGQVEQTLGAAVKAAIDGDGEIAGPRPNGVFGLFGRQRRDGKVEIGWQYSPIEQASPPKEMRIYGNGGTGEIDFGQPIATVQYKGRGFYSFENEPTGEGLYRFAVRAADVRGNECEDTRKIEVEVRSKTIEAIEIIDASVI